jgi:hypothetical protein
MYFTTGSDQNGLVKLRLSNEGPDFDSSIESTESDCWTEDECGSECDAAYETDPTDYSGEEEDDEDDGEDDDEDDDFARLLAGNEHPPEYYLQQIKEFDDVKNTEENYSDGTTLMLDHLEEQWYL